MNKNSYRGKTKSRVLSHIRLQRGLAFGVIIVGALIAFEAFNYSTTDFALNDLLGELEFFGVRWATILAIAFCGIDFAGIARLFTPEENQPDRNEAWYLFGAWLLAATMNAMLTWWGVSIAIANHQTLGNGVVDRETLLRVVPIFVAVLVWLIRVLIIGTFSVAGDRLFSQADVRYSANRGRSGVAPSSQLTRSLGSGSMKPRASASSSHSGSFRPAPKQTNQADPGYQRPEPTYAPLHMSGVRDESSSGKVNPSAHPFSSRASFK